MKLEAENWSYMSRSQGMPKAVSYYQNLGEMHGTDFPSETLLGTNNDFSLLTSKL